MKRFLTLFLFAVFGLAGNYDILAGEEWLSGVYITGVNCPNCAKTDPIVFKKTLNLNPRLIIFEYEMHDHGDENRPVAIEYFQAYFPKEAPGIPCLIFDKEDKGVGRINVTDLAEMVADDKDMVSPFPASDGSSINFDDLDLNDLTGHIQIWHRNRILFPGKECDSDLLKDVLTSRDIEVKLRSVEHEKTEPFDVRISRDHISFDNAVKIGDSVILWRGTSSQKNMVEKMDKVRDEDKAAAVPVIAGTPPSIYAILLLLVIFFLFYMIDRRNMIKAGTLPPMTETQKNIMVVGLAFVFLAGFFILASSISPSAIEDMGYHLPLPIFTLMVALVDGFNPCNMFVLTFLMALIVSASHSRLRIYIVGYSFVLVVYIIYFLFMSAWLNIFKYIGFIDPLRITIAVIALIAGLINCKELLFFKKGLSLTTGEKGRSFLDKKTRKIKGVIKNGSIPVLIVSSITLGFFASLIELPCTAGFPIVYTTVLSGLEISESSFTHYFWIALYNLFYIIPLAVIIFVFGYTFRGKAISEAAVRRIKFIGGFIMIILGIILLVNPAMIGIGM
ncbi:MAG TPA: hypothetical protein ENN58_02435 [bacterium]|nr:hypothetical protein [bacterium]